MGLCGTCICAVSECESGQARLVGRDVVTKGLVEVCYNDTWGQVCYQSWDDSDATVLCRQAGFSDQCQYIMCQACKIVE